MDLTKDEIFKTEFTQLEAWVQDRSVAPLRRRLPSFLREYGDQRPDLIFQVCDWYRRLGLHEHGLRCLKIDAPITRSPQKEYDRKRLLWAARFLNLLGATEFAQSLLRYFKPKSFDDYRILGSIHLAHFDFASAASALERMNELDDDSSGYLSRLSQLNLADAWSGLGRWKEAVALARKTGERSSEPLLQGIALQAQGEYLARQEKWNEALALLVRAEEYFPKGDQSPDRAFLLKWLGHTQLNLGQKNRGFRNLDAAYAILREKALRPEAWLDVCRLKVLAQGSRQAVGVELARYPGLSEGFRATFPKRWRDRTGLVAQRRGADFKFKIDLNRNEYIEGGRKFLGLPLEMRALAMIHLAGDWGLPLVKLKSLLWPEQAHAFLQLGARVDQIIHRLRRFHGIEVTLEDGLVRSNVPVLVDFKEGGDERPSFLCQGNGLFGRAELQTYYRLKSAQACRYLKEWEARGWICREGGGRNARYQVNKV